MRVAHDKKENLRKYVRYIESAAANNIDLLAFPECSLQGYTWTWDFQRHIYRKDRKQQEYFSIQSETIPGPSTSLISKLARQNQMYVVMGMAEKAKRNSKSVIYNSAVLIGPKGIIGVHRKVHQAPNPVFTKGCRFSVFSTAIGKIGMVVCADLQYPESGRCLALQGAQIIVNSTAWGMHSRTPDPRTDPGGYDYDLATRATARFNRIWLVSADQVGASTRSEETCYGHSRIVDPDGRIVADSDFREGLVTAAANINAVAGLARLKGRRPQCYSPLVRYPFQKTPWIDLTSAGKRAQQIHNA
jgi:predicted amidohydrolase